MLGAMKGVKISGLSQRLSILVQDLRLGEIASAARFRVMLIYIVTLGK
jgi:hypothetical protein